MRKKESKYYIHSMRREIVKYERNHSFLGGLISNGDRACVSEWVSEWVNHNIYRRKSELVVLLTEIVFVNNVEIIFSEIFTDDISGGIGGFVSDIGEEIELVRRRRGGGGGGHCSKAKSGRGQFVGLELELELATEGIVIVFLIRRNLRVKKKKMTLWQQHFTWSCWLERKTDAGVGEGISDLTLVKTTIFEYIQWLLLFSFFFFLPKYTICY